MKLLSIALAGLISSVCHAVIGGMDIHHRIESPESSVVALQLNYLEPDGTKSFKKASGVLIADHIILTAGHNLFYMSAASDVEAIASTQPCWGPNVCRELRIQGLKKFIHPDFKNDYPLPPENDIALLYLQSAFPDSFEPAKLPAKRSKIKTLQFLGYGLSLHSIEQPPLDDFRLRKVILDLVNPGYLLGSSELFWVDQTKKGFCGGDSGGPAFLANSSEVIGLASHTSTNSEGESTCLTSGGLVDVTHYLSWITKTLTENP